MHNCIKKSCIIIFKLNLKIINYMKKKIIKKIRYNEYVGTSNVRVNNYVMYNSNVNVYTIY